MRQGIPVVVLDDDDRENEVDLIVAAERLDDARRAGQCLRGGARPANADIADLADYVASH
ncbi:hypothetical protein GCM10022279_09900 [Comamonas faecalis]|uniref:3,4-dihydroxy-2-butanone 4-phosphate synthase n=1 Tax=Comamonas faecalis TaxID=1387849 RepID=A0ABP7QVR5_9BURK